MSTQISTLETFDVRSNREKLFDKISKAKTRVERATLELQLAKLDEERDGNVDSLLSGEELITTTEVCKQVEQRTGKVIRPKDMNINLIEMGLQTRDSTGFYLTEKALSCEMGRRIKTGVYWINWSPRVVDLIVSEMNGKK